MLPLSLLGLAFYALVLIGAFAVRSAAGFGAVLVAVPMLSFVLPVPTAVSVATALTVAMSARHVHRDWHRIAWKQFIIVTLYTMLGIGLGFYFIRILDEKTLRGGLGAFLILYSLHVLFSGGRPIMPSARWQGALAACAGVSGGFLGALFGGGVGPIYIIYFNSLRLEREVFRVTMTAGMLVSGTARVAGYASFGFYRGGPLALLAVGLPLAIIGSWAGDRLVRNLNPRLFSFFVGTLVLLSGVAVLLR